MRHFQDRMLAVKALREILAMVESHANFPPCRDVKGVAEGALSVLGELKGETTDFDPPRRKWWQR